MWKTEYTGLYLLVYQASQTESKVVNKVQTHKDRKIGQEMKLMQNVKKLLEGRKDMMRKPWSNMPFSHSTSETLKN